MHEVYLYIDVKNTYGYDWFKKIDVSLKLQCGGS